MATKPLTINAGRIEQLADGQGLDVGGWNLPTSGGTENYVLIADSSGHAIWSSTLVGLTSLTVDNININGAVITSDTGAISFSDENLSTSGTVTGSNIPSPSVDDQVLISTAAGVAGWSTAGNDQYLASSGSGEVAWANKPAAMANPTADNQLLESTGSGTAAWTDTLDILKVDSITINGAVISSDTGAISFDNENLSTTGDLTVGRVTSWRDNSGGADAAGIFTRFQAGGGIPNSVIRVIFEEDSAGESVLIDGTGPAIQFENKNEEEATNIIAKIAARRREDDDSSGSLDFYTYSGGVATCGGRFNPDGSFTLLEGLTVTGGPVVGSNVPSPTVDDQVLISTAADTAAWSTAGNDQYLASDGSGEVAWIAKPALASNPTADDQVLISTGVDAASWSTASTNQVLASDGAGEVAWANKPFGYNIPANSAQYQVYVGTGVGTAAWTTDLAGLTSLTVDNITINGAVISSDTGAISFSNENLSTSGTVVGSNIPSPTVDDQVLISTAAGVASWSTAGNDQYLASNGSGEAAWANKPAAMAQPTADNQLLESTGSGTAAWTDTLDILKVDNITINGAAITSDTGAISFSNENLSTTGTMVGSNIPSPTVDDQVLISTASGVAAWSTASTNQILASDGAGEVAWANKPFGYNMASPASSGQVYVATGAGAASWTTALTGLTNLTVDNININGAVITSDTGAISFSNENLTTTGYVAANNAVLTGSIRHYFNDNAYSYTKVFSKYATGSTTGTCVVDLPMAYVNTMMAIKIRGYNYSTPGGPWEMLIGGYNYDTEPDRWYHYHAAVHGHVPFTNIRLGYNGNTDKACIMLGATSTQWSYAIVEVSDVLASHGSAGSYGSGWDINWYTDETNFYNNDPDQQDPQTVAWNRDYPAPSADNQLLASTGDKVASWTDTLDILKVDNITIDGAVITSDTGAISFSNENLTTTGSMTANTITDGTASLTGGSLTGVKLGSLTSNGFVKTSGSNGTLSVDASTYLTDEVDTLDTVADRGATTNQSITTGGLTTTGTVDAGLLTVDNITINGAVITSDTGTISFSNENLTTTGLVTAGNLQVDNININGAVISSNTGAISFSNENLTSTGTIVGKNIPSPSTSGKALVSTAAGTGTWYTTSLYDVLKIEVPSASGAERKFVLTADPGSQFEIEPAPWPLTLTANETVYVRTTGNDTTGDGSSSYPFLTLNRTVEYLGGLYIGDYTVTVDIGEGTFTEAGVITFMHPFGTQVTFQGVSERITGQSIASISGTTSYGHNNLYYRNVTMVLPVGKSVAVGNYIGIASATGGTNPNALIGVHKVSAWVSGTRTATIQVSYRNGSETPSGAITCSIDLIKSVIAFSNKNGLKIIGPFYGGNWRGLVIQGDYNGANSSLYGVWALNGSVVSLSGADTSGFACGVWGFRTNLYAQNNSLIFADYAYATKCGQHICSCQNGGILGLRYSRISACNNYGIYAFNGSTVAASNVTVVGTGDNSIVSYQGSFIDLRNAFVGESNSTTSIYADRWAAIDGTGATVDDAISPAVDGNNDGSYVIGL